MQYRPFGIQYAHIILVSSMSRDIYRKYTEHLKLKRSTKLFEQTANICFRSINAVLPIILTFKDIITLTNIT